MKKSETTAVARRTTAVKQSSGSERGKAARPRYSPRLAAIPADPSNKIHGGVQVGTFLGFSTAGDRLVDFPENTSQLPVAARTTVELADRDRGKPIVLAFECGDPTRPIIIGLVRGERETDIHGAAAPPSDRLKIEIDGETLHLTAQSQIVLTCGESSITLTRAGKIVIKGSYVVSRSSGVNKIKGGSIQLN